MYEPPALGVGYPTVQAIEEINLNQVAWSNRIKIADQGESNMWEEMGLISC
jgi:hypothetical protein